MKQKISKRIEELTSDINSLAKKREEYIKELRMLDLNIEVLSGAIFELSRLLEDKE